MDRAYLLKLEGLAKKGSRRARQWALLNGVAVHSAINGKLIRQYPDGRQVVVENSLRGPEREIPYANA